MIGRKLRADRAVAVFLLHIRRSTHKLATDIVIDKEGRIAADIRDCAIDDPVIGEFRHLADLDPINDAIPKADFRIGIGFAEGEGECAKVDVVSRSAPILKSRASNQ
jgi:hypothetical protein